MIVNIVTLILALGLVIKSADWFLGAAESIGVRLGLSSFALGVLLVGFGTSLPELATSIAATIDNSQNVTIANIIGSNLANMLIIIGLATFFMGTVRFEKDLIDLDLPLLFSVTALFIILMVDGNLTNLDGVFLLLGFLGYVFYTLAYKEDKKYHQGLIRLIATLARDTNDEGEAKPEVSSAMAPTLAVLIGSVVLLAAASAVTVQNLLDIVEQVDYSVDIITFFTIAIGTSLPELLVSFKALKSCKGDIVLGNIIGSSIFNILLIGGSASLIKTQYLASELVFWSLFGLGLACVLLMVSGITRRIHVWEGFMFLLIYGAIATRLLS